METDLLDYFLRIAELGSINRAAASLHISQPALSRHVGALEHAMGTLLFTRTQGGVHLTDAGRLLADRARPLLRHVAMLKEQVGEKAAGHLAVGTPPAWQRMIVSPFVEALAAQHPAVVLRVHEGVSNLLREHMADGLLDIGVVPFDAAPAPGYRQTPLVREPIALVGRAQDGLSPDRPVGLSRLDGLKLVLPRRPNVLRAQVERAMEREGLAFRLAVETDTLSLCLDLARRGVGATLVPVCSLLCNGSDAALGWAPVAGQSITWALWDNLARTHSQAVREGRRLLVATVAEALARGVWVGAERVEAV